MGFDDALSQRRSVSVVRREARAPVEGRRQRDTLPASQTRSSSSGPRSRTSSSLGVYDRYDGARSARGSSDIARQLSRTFAAPAPAPAPVPTERAYSAASSNASSSDRRLFGGPRMERLPSPTFSSEGESPRDAKVSHQIKAAMEAQHTQRLARRAAAPSSHPVYVRAPSPEAQRRTVEPPPPPTVPLSTNSTVPAHPRRNPTHGQGPSPSESPSYYRSTLPVTERLYQPSQAPAPRTHHRAEDRSTRREGRSASSATPTTAREGRTAQQKEREHRDRVARSSSQGRVNYAFGRSFTVPEERPPRTQSQDRGRPSSRVVTPLTRDSSSGRQSNGSSWEERLHDGKLKERQEKLEHLKHQLEIQKEEQHRANCTFQPKTTQPPKYLRDVSTNVYSYGAPVVKNYPSSRQDSITPRSARSPSANSVFQRLYESTKQPDSHQNLSHENVSTAYGQKIVRGRSRSGGRPDSTSTATPTGKGGRTASVPRLDFSKMSGREGTPSSASSRPSRSRSEGSSRRSGPRYPTRLQERAYARSSSSYASTLTKEAPPDHPPAPKPSSRKSAEKNSPKRTRKPRNTTSIDLTDGHMEAIVAQPEIDFLDEPSIGSSISTSTSESSPRMSSQNISGGAIGTHSPPESPECEPSPPSLPMFTSEEEMVLPVRVPPSPPAIPPPVAPPATGAISHSWSVEPPPPPAELPRAAYQPPAPPEAEAPFEPPPLQLAPPITKAGNHDMLHNHLASRSAMKSLKPKYLHPSAVGVSDKGGSTNPSSARPVARPAGRGSSSRSRSLPPASRMNTTHTRMPQPQALSTFIDSPPDARHKKQRSASVGANSAFRRALVREGVPDRMLTIRPEEGTGSVGVDTASSIETPSSKGKGKKGIMKFFQKKDTTPPQAAAAPQPPTLRPYRPIRSSAGTYISDSEDEKGTFEPPRERAPEDDDITREFKNLYGRVPKKWEEGIQLTPIS